MPINSFRVFEVDDPSETNFASDAAPQIILLHRIMAVLIVNHHLQRRLSHATILDLGIWIQWLATSFPVHHVVAIAVSHVVQIKIPNDFVLKTKKSVYKILRTLS